jgi:hypothetical protein
MVIGDNHFPARRKVMPMPMETGIRAPPKTRIGTPMAGHTFKRPDRPTLEELPKQEVKKSGVRDTRERNALNQANSHYRDCRAATVTSYAHSKNRTVKIPTLVRLGHLSEDVEASWPIFSRLSVSVRIRHG